MTREAGAVSAADRGHASIGAAGIFFPPVMIPRPKRRPFVRAIPAILCLTLIAVATISEGQNEAPAARISSIIDHRVQSRPGLNLVVGYVDKEGSRVFSAGSRKLDGRTVFEIGSLTKVFTGILLAEAVRRGEVALDQPVTELMPAGFKFASPETGRVTLLDLAGHGAGLPRMPGNWEPKDPKNPYAGYKTRDLYAALAGENGGGRSGSAYQYSNFGYGLLGHLLARRAGTDYKTLVVDRVCRPLGMNDTRIRLTSGMQKRFTQGHDGAGEPVPPWDFGVLAGCGALRSTADDLLKLLGACAGLNRTPLNPSLLEAARARRPGPVPEMRVGLGWMVLTAEGRQVVMHDGGTSGFGAFMGYTTEPRAGVIVLSNTGILAENISDIGLHLLDERIPLNQAPRRVKLPTEVLETYLGRYQVPDGPIITITRGGDGLLYQEGDEEKPTPIEALNEDEFYFKAFAGIRIRFRKDARGRVGGMTILAPGQEIEAPRMD
ncbi:MAG: serine hydrolase [Proteobacteria bacterium]|nr:serine hydrolase [Pseudomonadota bacterium]